MPVRTINLIEYFYYTFSFPCFCPLWIIFYRFLTVFPYLSHSSSGIVSSSDIVSSSHLPSLLLIFLSLSSVTISFSNTHYLRITYLYIPLFLFHLFSSIFFSKSVKRLFSVILSFGFRIRWLCPHPLQKDKTPPTKRRCSMHDTKLHLVMRSVLYSLIL